MASNTIIGLTQLFSWSAQKLHENLMRKSCWYFETLFNVKANCLSHLMCWPSILIINLICKIKLIELVMKFTSFRIYASLNVSCNVSWKLQCDIMGQRGSKSLIIVNLTDDKKASNVCFGKLKQNWESICLKTGNWMLLIPDLMLDFLYIYLISLLWYFITLMTKKRKTEKHIW